MTYRLDLAIQNEFLDSEMKCGGAANFISQYDIAPRPGEIASPFGPRTAVAMAGLLL